MGEAWYVARTKPLCEYIATAHLDGTVDYFFPVVSTASPRRGHQDAPLFPGYLFLRYDPESPVSTILRTVPGLKGLVAFDGVAPAVPDFVIDGLRRRVAEINGGGGLYPRFRPGDRVWVQLGSRRGTEDLGEVVAEKSAQGRVRVLLHFLGRLAQAEVPRANIRPARADEAADFPLRAGDGRGPAPAKAGERWRGTRGRGRHFASAMS